jgi:hypothetical protein
MNHTYRHKQRGHNIQLLLLAMVLQQSLLQICLTEAQIRDTVSKNH